MTAPESAPGIRPLGVHIFDRRYLVHSHILGSGYDQIFERCATIEDARAAAADMITDGKRYAYITDKRNPYHTLERIDA